MLLLKAKSLVASPGTPGEGQGEGLSQFRMMNAECRIALTPALSRCTGRGRNAASRLLIILVLGFGIGCQHERCPSTNDEAEAIAERSTEGLQSPQVNMDVQAIAVPPVGWKPEALKSSTRHKHQVWVSPSGATAYGIIYLNLPFPVGPDLTLWGFLQQMEKSDGRAELLSKEADDRLPGLRFVAVGEKYTIRTNLTVSGFHAWAVYAGTRNKRAINQDELAIASRAREQTRVSLP